MNSFHSSPKCLNDYDPVVMVDDNPIDVTIAKKVYSLSDLPNPFLHFPSGADFLDYMVKVKAEDSPIPAIVLLDINMPNLNGFETIKEMRNQEVFKHIPMVIMFTNSDDPADIELAKDLGADGFQTKYFEIAKYIEFFNSLRADPE